MEWGIFIKHTSYVYTNWNALYVHPIFACAALYPHKRILNALVWGQAETAGVCVTGGYCCCLLWFFPFLLWFLWLFLLAFSFSFFFGFFFLLFFFSFGLLHANYFVNGQYSVASFLFFRIALFLFFLSSVWGAACGKRFFNCLNKAVWNWKIQN